jgi:hypothetical protein
MYFILVIILPPVFLISDFLMFARDIGHTIVDGPRRSFLLRTKHHNDSHQSVGERIGDTKCNGYAFCTQEIFLKLCEELRGTRNGR